MSRRNMLRGRGGFGEDFKLARNDGDLFRLHAAMPASAPDAPANLIAPGWTNALTSSQRTIFSANDGTNGQELWITDGTAAGTVMLKNINPGSSNSNPTGFQLVDGKVVFLATTLNEGRELWTTDGTAAGTYLLKDINPGTAGSTPDSFVGLGTKLVFIASDATNGRELWVTDGTAAGTILLKDINLGANNSNPSNIVAYNGKVVFTATDASGFQLWQTDGTPAGTTKITSISELAVGSLTLAGDKLIFQGKTGAASNDYELWVTDGTAAGTTLLKDINPGSTGSFPNAFATFGDKAVFVASPSNPVIGETWITDGTAAGTFRLTTTQGSNFTRFGSDKMLFNGAGELWITDGTAAGTMLVKDINPGGISSPQTFFEFGGKMYFRASDGQNGGELWVTDGTPAGTQLFKDINPGSGDSFPTNFASLGSHFLFSAVDATNGRELWISDGTAAGTMLLSNINPGAISGSPSSLFTFDIAVAAVPPVVDLNGPASGTGSSLNYIENGVEALAPAATVTDADSADFDTGTLTVSFTANGSSEDRLTILNQGSGAGQISVAGNAVSYQGVQIGTFTGGTNGSTPLVVTLDADATPAAVEALTRAIAYSNISDAPSTAARSVEFILTDGDGGTSTAAVATITVTAVNDAPVLDATKSPVLGGIAEDSGAPANAVGTLVSSIVDSATPAGGLDNVTDADGPGLGIAITGVNGANGTLFYSTNNGASWTAVGPVSNSSALLLAADANTRLYFQPASNFNGSISDVITFRAWDQTSGAAGSKVDTGTNGGTTAFSTATDTVSLTVTPVNDAPSGTDASRTILEDGTYLFAVADFGFSDAVENDGFAGVVLTTLPANGTLLLNGSPVTIAGSFVTAAQILAGQLSFVPTTNASGAGYGNFTFQVRDTGGTANGGQDTDQSPNSFTINVTPVNDAPTSTGFDNITYVEGSGAQQLDVGFNQVLTDVDSPNFDGGTLTFRVSGNLVATEDQLTFLTGGTSFLAVSGNTISYQGVTFATFTAGGLGLSRTFTFNSDATVQAVQTLMRNLAYINQNQADPSTATRTMEYVLTDGDGGTLTLTSTISVVGVNDAPSGTDATFTINEDATHIFTATDFGFSDAAEGNAFAGVVIATLPAGGALLFDADGPGGAPAVALSAGAFVSAADIALGRLTYTPAANASGSPQAAFTFQVRDNGGTANGGQDTDQSANTITFNVSAVNDAPVVTIVTAPTLGGMSMITEWTDLESAAGEMPALVWGSADGLGANRIGLSVTFENGLTGTVIYNNVSGLWNSSFTGIDYESATGFFTAADGLHYLYANGASLPMAWEDFVMPFSGNFDLDYYSGNSTFRADVSGWGSAVFRTFSDAAPGGGGDFAAVEQVALDLKGTIAVSDVDAGSGLVSLTLSVAYGVIDIGVGTSGASIVSGNGTGTVVLSGTIAQLQALLNTDATSSVAFTANTDTPPASTTLIITVNDNGNTGAGGAQTGTAMQTIAITAVNDAPSGTDNTVTGSEDDPYVFTLADFGFSDPVEGNAFLAIRINSFPANGALMFDPDGPGGAAPVNLAGVGVGVFVGAADIAAGHLYFQPDPDEYGDGYASFLFQVQDDGGTANGGVDLDPTNNTITIDIEPDNLPPVVDLDGGTAGIDYTTTFVEDGAPVAIGSGIIVSDPDAVPLGDMIEGAVVTLTDRVAGDSLVFSSPLPSGFTAIFTSNATSITIEIFGTGTQAQYASILQSVVYSTTSQDPDVGGTDTSRTITVTVDDGDIDSAVATTTINIAAVDDLPVAQPDYFTITESGTIVNASLFADNGSGADSDPDGPPLSISAVNGSAGNVGSQITLGSGALLTVNANGTFSYDPNGAFLPTPTAGSGASNTPAHDGFTYTLAGGNTVSVFITLTGLDTDDFLLGTAGNDVLMGGLGNDTYIVGNTADQVIEAAGQGFDSVFTSVSYALAAGSEIEWLAAADETATTSLALVGNGFAQYLVGNDGANIFSGGGGADIMIGHDGNDTYYVTDAATAVEEAAGEGFDAVYSSVSYTLTAGSEVEWLSTINVAATTAINLTGNAFGNYVIGNAGMNILDGGAGADLLYGYGGHDTYRVDNAGDQVFESVGNGFDSVYVTTSWALGAGQEVEWLSTADVTGTANINITGNEFVNYIVGNAGNNVLNGGGGADFLYGYGGNDIYLVTAGTLVFESAGGGNDSVVASTSYTLNNGAEVEFLGTNDSTATTAIDLTGNELDNVIYGNAGSNVLDGKGGNDVLFGLAGADTFAFTTALGANNVDIILDFTHNVDRIALDDAIFTALGGPGSLNANAFVVGAAAADAADRIIYNNLTGQLFYDADGNGAGAAVLFANLNPGLTISASDFLVI